MNATANPDAIVVTGLRKAFGDHVVLDGIDLAVEAGTVFALLGPNGAGKTTIVNLLSTLLPADAGEVTVDGHDLRRNPGGIRGASASPASSRRSTACSPGARTCGSWPTSPTSAGAPPPGSCPNCSSGST